MIAKKSGLTVLLTIFTVFLPALAGAAEQPISEAEKHLFLDNHMKNIPLPSTLRYRFEKTGTLEAGFQDNAVITVERGSAGKGSLAKVNYLTGKNNMKVPEVQNAEGNPVILSFLEREILEMKRLTGGSSNYYRKRIRLSLVDEASVKPVTVKYNGKDVRASEISISPYVNDPARSRYEKFAEKYYVFTLSDEIPGGVYQMRGILAGKGSESGQKPGPILEETLTFAGLTK